MILGDSMVNNKKKHRVNKFLYVSLFLLSIVVILVSLFFAIDSKWFVLLSGIGCGSFASVLVALLIEIFHCREMNEKSVHVLNFAIEDIGAAIADYCDRYSYFVISMDEKYKCELHTFLEWVQLYAQLVADGKPQVRKTYVTGAMDSVKEAFDLFYNNRVWYLENDYLTKEEFKAISRMCKSIFTSKLHYMISDVEISSISIVEINQEISECMLKTKDFSKFANTKYSYHQSLSSMFVHDEYDDE